MAIMEIFLMLSSSILVLSTNQRDVIFTNSDYGHDVVMKTGVLSKLHTSTIHCASICYRRRSCRGYFYNRLTRTCQLQATAYDGHQQVVSEKGWLYFNIQSIGPTVNSLDELIGSVSTTTKSEHQPAPESKRRAQEPNSSTDVPARARPSWKISRLRLLSTTATTRSSSNVEVTATYSAAPTDRPITANDDGELKTADEKESLDNHVSQRLSGEQVKPNTSIEQMNTSNGSVEDLNISDGFGEQLNKSVGLAEEFDKSGEVNEEVDNSVRFGEEFDKSDGVVKEFDKSEDHSKELDTPNSASKMMAGVCDGRTEEECVSDGPNGLFRKPNVLGDEMDTSNEEMTILSEEMNIPMEEVDAPSEDIDTKSEEMGIPMEEVDAPSEDIDAIDEELNMPIEKPCTFDSLSDDFPKSDETIETLDIPGKEMKSPSEPMDTSDGPSEEAGVPHGPRRQLVIPDGPSEDIDTSDGFNKDLETSDGRNKDLSKPDGRKTNLDKSDKFKEDLDTSDKLKEDFDMSDELNEDLGTSDKLNNELDIPIGIIEKQNLSGGNSQQLNISSERVSTTHGSGGDARTIKPSGETGPDDGIAEGYNFKDPKTRQKSRYFQRYKVVTMDQKESLGDVELNLNIQDNRAQHRETDTYRATDWCERHQRHPLCFAIAEDFKKRIQITSGLETALIPLAIIGVLLPTILGLLYAARTGFTAISFRRPRAAIKDELKVTLVQA